MSERILIVRLSALGDTALTLPLLWLLRERLPEAFIGWVVEEKAASLLQGLPGLDRLHVWPQKQKNLRGAWKLAQELRATGYQHALDVQGLTKSAILPLLARIPHRVGLRRAPMESRELAPIFNNHLITPPPELTHVSLRVRHLAQGLNLQPPYPAIEQLPPMYVDPKILQEMRDWWSAAVGGRGLVFGVGTSWPTKIWPAEHMAHVIRAARARGWKTVVTWGPNEEDKLPDWHRLFGDEVIWSPRTGSVQQMAALLACAGGYAGPDSAPLHIAWLLKKPTFSWFGPSDPRRCAPVGAGNAFIAAHAPTRQREGDMLWCLQPERVLTDFLPWLDAIPC